MPDVGIITRDSKTSTLVVSRCFEKKKKPNFLVAAAVERAVSGRQSSHEHLEGHT